jgi:hypothetical protein
MELTPRTRGDRSHHWQFSAGVTEYGGVIEFTNAVGHVEVAIVEVQRFFYLSCNLIAYAFRWVFASECAYLRWGLAQQLGNINQTELLLSQDSSEILKAGV